MDGEATEGRPTPSNRSSPPRLVFPDRRDGPSPEGYTVNWIRRITRKLRLDIEVRRPTVRRRVAATLALTEAVRR